MEAFLWRKRGKNEREKGPVLILCGPCQSFDVEKVLSTKSPQRGFGFTSMRERTEISGGVFAIESVKGKGTTITASWKATTAPQ